MPGAPPAALFQGFDSFTNEGRSTATTGPSVSTGGSKESYYRVCTDFQSLQTALDISGSISASFGFGSAGVKAQFVDNLQVTNTSVVIVVYASIVLGTNTATNPQLLDQAPPDSPAAANTFFQAFGDSFVNTIVTGAEYFAAYVFYAESVSEQRQITTALDAHGISTSGTLSASLQADLNTVQEAVSTRQIFQQQTTGFAQLALPPPSGIIDFALNFPPTAPDTPTIISYTTEGYEHVAGIPSSFQTVVNNRNLYDGIGTQLGLSGEYAQLIATQNAAMSIAQAYQTYGYTGDSLLSARSATIALDIQALEALFADLENDPTKTYPLPQLQSLSFGQPALNVTIGTAGPYGGPGGASFDDVNETSVADMLLLQQFSVQGDAWVNAIQPTYASVAGPPFSPIHGSNVGSLSSVLQLEPDERVVKVSGTYGFVDASNVFVIDLRIDTSAGNSLQWPQDPTPNGNPFQWSKVDNVVFLGFAGAASTSLNQLSIRTVAFQPAIWQT